MVRLQWTQVTVWREFPSFQILGRGIHKESQQSLSWDIIESEKANKANVYKRRVLEYRELHWEIAPEVYSGLPWAFSWVLSGYACEKTTQAWRKNKPKEAEETTGTYCTAMNERKGKWKLLSHVQLFATPWTIQSMKFSRPEYWSGLPCPSPGDLPNPGIEPRSLTLRADSLPAAPQGKS